MNRLMILCGAISMPLVAQAEWTLLDDFNDADATNSRISLVTSSSSAEIWVGQPDSSDANTALFVESGDQGISYADTFAYLTLPQGIGAGQTATIFWRARNEGVSNNWHITLTDVQDANSWSNQGLIVRYETGGQIVVRNGGNYFDTVPELIPQLSTWYSYWAVVTYDTSSYNLYYQGPDDSAPIQLMAAGDPAVADLGFRAIPVAALNYLSIATNSDHPLGPNLDDMFFIDDLYIATGDDLSNPITGAADPRSSETWGGFTVVDGWADTGAWLGPLYVAWAPWVYSDSASAWMWVDEPSEADPGVWAYIYK